MNIKNIARLIIGFFLSLSLFSCNDKDNTITYGSQTKDAQIYSFSISAGYPKRDSETERAKDTVRLAQVNKTKFAIDQVAGVIYNPDSMPYGTLLNKVKVTTTYNPLYGAASVKVIIPDSVQGGYIWNNSDSINFEKMPIRFNVTSLEGASKEYEIKILIHQIDPDTIIWKQMQSYPATIGKSKTVLKQNKFYSFGISSNSLNLYTGTVSDNVAWKKEALTGLPSTVNINSITLLGDHFFAIDAAGKAYESGDGLKWTAATNSKNIFSILGIVPGATEADNQLLLVLKDGSGYTFAQTKDMLTIEDVKSFDGSSKMSIPKDFPIKEAASYSNLSTDNKSRMLLLTGGLSQSNQELAYTWLIRSNKGSIEMAPFRNNSLFKGSGISIFVYGDAFYALVNNQLYISNTWGEEWQKAPAKENLISSIAKRKSQSAVVDPSNNIWIFGGISSKGTFLNDVWKGRLNKLIP